MGDWILYDEFVDLVRNHHHQAYSGLITGVSDSRHSFQVGFEHGEIVLLTYRIRKGLQALPYLCKIERAKISEHRTTEIQDASSGTLDTDTVLAELVANTLDETTTITTDIRDVTRPRQVKRRVISSSLHPRAQKAIENAAVRHFGPIGALACEKLLSNSAGDLRSIALAIVEEVGASDAEARAFFESISKG